MIAAAPAKRPCAACPYRRDAPSGVWSHEQYEALRGYDRPTGEQPPGVFHCHRHETAAPGARVCAGWAGTHANNPPGHELLALRLAVAFKVLSADTAAACAGYRTPTPLFDTAAAAAEHGQADIAAPGPAAIAAIAAIRRHRSDVLDERGRPFTLRGVR